MELEDIALPFDIDILLHPLFVHYILAFPVIILFLEIINILINKKTISAVNVFLLFVSIIISIAVYFTGLVDAKESLVLLNDDAKELLTQHKLWGIYLILTVFVVFILKLISMFTGNFFKVIYIFALFVLLGGLLSQGRQGIKLVYTHGINISKVKVLVDIIKVSEALRKDFQDKNKALSKEIDGLYKDKDEALHRLKALQVDFKRLEENNISDEYNNTYKGE